MLQLSLLRLVRWRGRRSASPRSDEHAAVTEMLCDWPCTAAGSSWVSGQGVLGDGAARIVHIAVVTGAHTPQTCIDSTCIGVESPRGISPVTLREGQATARARQMLDAQRRSTPRDIHVKRHVQFVFCKASQTSSSTIADYAHASTPGPYEPALQKSGGRQRRESLPDGKPFIADSACPSFQLQLRIYRRGPARSPQRCTAYRKAAPSPADSPQARRRCGTPCP